MNLSNSTLINHMFFFNYMRKGRKKITPWQGRHLKHQLEKVLEEDYKFEQVVWYYGAKLCKEIRTNITFPKNIMKRILQSINR